MEEKFLIRLISFCNYADHIHKQFEIIVVMHTAVEMNHLRLKVTQFYDVNGRERERVCTHTLMYCLLVFISLLISLFWHVLYANVPM